MLVERVAIGGNKTALMFKEGKGPYRSTSWVDFGRMVEELAYGLVVLGFGTGERAAIMAATSHHWVIADQAILAAAGVSVPVYPTSSAQDIEHILNNSDSRILFVHNESLLRKVLAVKDRLPRLERIVLLAAPARGRSLAEVCQELGVDGTYVMGLEELQNHGRTLKAEKPKLIADRIAGIKYDDLATIIYTSGTTGTPKGVMLLNSTILSILNDLPPRVCIGEDDVLLEFLPLSHVFERVCGEFYWIYRGMNCAFAEGLEHVARNMQEVSPHIMLVVPRLLDKIYAKVNSGIEGASPRAQRLIRWALEVGKEAVRHRNEDIPMRPGLKAKYWLAQKLVLNKLKDRIGSRLKMIVSGGAPATAAVIEFFNAIGINVVEGYGLTETAAPTNVNLIGKNKFGTVGPPFPSVQMRLADDGEVLFRGPTIFAGYFKSPEMTREAIDEDGWFHSGDIGVIDADGYLKITDRKKDIIVNSAGKNIAPQKIEAVLKMVPHVSQAVVFGDKHKSLVALLTLEEQSITEYAREHGWNFNDYNQLVALPQLKRMIKKEIQSRSGSLADYEQVRNFAVLSEELSVEKGELTATMKIKRNVIQQNHKTLVDSLHREDSVLVGSK